MPPKCILAVRPKSLGALIGPKNCKVKTKKNPTTSAYKVKPIIGPLTREFANNPQDQSLTLFIDNGITKIPVVCNYDSGWGPDQLAITKKFYIEHFAPTKPDGTKDSSLFDRTDTTDVLFIAPVGMKYEQNGAPQEIVLQRIPIANVFPIAHDGIFGPGLLNKLEAALNRKIKFKTIVK